MARASAGFTWAGCCRQTPQKQEPGLGFSQERRAARKRMTPRKPEVALLRQNHTPLRPQTRSFRPSQVERRFSGPLGQTDRTTQRNINSAGHRARQDEKPPTRCDVSVLVVHGPAGPRQPDAIHKLFSRLTKGKQDLPSPKVTDVTYSRSKRKGYRCPLSSFVCLALMVIVGRHRRDTLQMRLLIQWL
jgi:hypothetical protein